MLTASAEVHGMGDGVVAVNGEGDQHVSRGVDDDRLQEANEFAEDIACVPGHRYPPGDVGRHVNQAHRQIYIHKKKHFTQTRLQV